jgi:hypothetical protein
MPNDNVRVPHGSRTGKITSLSNTLKFTLVAGAVAGNVTVTGIAVGDEILHVLHNTIGTLADLTAEFSITAANTINNADGTATDGDQLLVVWADLT